MPVNMVPLDAGSNASGRGLKANHAHKETSDHHGIMLDPELKWVGCQTVIEPVLLLGN